MKALSITMAAFAALFFAGIVVSYATADTGVKFIDADGDGICDNAGKGGNGGNAEAKGDAVRSRDRVLDPENCEGDGECDGTGKQIRSGSDGEDANGTGDVTRIRKRTRTPGDCGGRTRRNIRSRSK